MEICKAQSEKCSCKLIYANCNLQNTFFEMKSVKCIIQNAIQKMQSTKFNPQMAIHKMQSVKCDMKYPI